MSFENESPRDLAQSVNKFFRDERAARLDRAETPQPKHFGSEDPNLRKQAHHEYMTALLAKSPSALTPAETKYIVREMGEFLRGDKD